jgi:2-haloacid dehalogenase
MDQPNAGPRGGAVELTNRVLLLDVNETLSDMRPLAARFEEVGLSGHLVTAWFAGVLRDGFALAVSGAYSDFATLARSGLLALLASEKLTPQAAQAAADHVVAGIAELPLHDDVPPALELLADRGIRVVTLTNGSRATTKALLERAGVAHLVEENLSVDEVGRWKPARQAYHYAVARCGVEPAQATLVAVHPWDVDGAMRAGLRGAWIDRRGLPYPLAFREPDVSAPDLVTFARRLADGADVVFQEA